MEYKVIALENDDDTSPGVIAATLNKYAQDDWRLVSTQFVPDVTVSSAQGYGRLLLFLERQESKE